MTFCDTITLEFHYLGRVFCQARRQNMTFYDTILTVTLNFAI